MICRNNKARQERKQQRLDSGLVSKYFPEVTRIIIDIIYKQKGLAKPVLRTLNLYPDSCAFFKVDCLSDVCVDGGFDLARIISTMVRNHSETSKGELDCDDNGPHPGHSNIVYEIAIQYA